MIGYLCVYLFVEHLINFILVILDYTSFSTPLNLLRALIVFPYFAHLSLAVESLTVLSLKLSSIDYVDSLSQSSYPSIWNLVIQGWLKHSSALSLKAGSSTNRVLTKSFPSELNECFMTNLVSSESLQPDIIKLFFLQSIIA